MTTRHRQDPAKQHHAEMLRATRLGWLAGPAVGALLNAAVTVALGAPAAVVQVDGDVYGDVTVCPDQHDAAPP